MDYKGKLYGKIDDRTYFPLLHTTDDWDNMVELLGELRDYMDNKADVDDGGYDEGGKFHHIANEEMRFRERIDELIHWSLDNGKRKQAKFNGYDLRVAYERFKKSKSVQITHQTDALMDFLLKESDAEESIRLYDEVLRTASDKTKSEVFQAMNGTTGFSYEKFELDIEANKKQFDANGELLSYQPGISPMPDWDMEAEFSKIGIPESRQGRPILFSPIGLELPKQLEIGMVAITKYGEVVEITQDDMPGYPYDCFIRLATASEIEILKPKKPKMSETETKTELFDDTNNPES